MISRDPQVGVTNDRGTGRNGHKTLTSQSPRENYREDDVAAALLRWFLGILATNDPEETRPNRSDV